jgi:glutaconate CoA-transferase subunit B
VLIYESGTIGTRPSVLPLSIGDGELAETATCVIPLPDVFSDYLQAGRIDIGFLGAAQIDKLGNLNSTVIGPYGKPKTRLPGAGGATEIAAHAREVFIVMKATPRSFVKQLDFPDQRRTLRRPRRERRAGRGPSVIVTDVGILKPHPETGEFALSTVYPGIPAEDARAAIGWPLTVLPTLETHAAPTEPELTALRALESRTAAAHREHREAAPMNASPRAAGTFKNPHIKMELPGPKSRAMIERDSKVASPSYPRDYPFVISHAKGTEAWDVDGNRFLDFAAGIAVCATGHAHPRVVKAVQDAAGKFLHISSDYWHEEMTALAERLSAIVPLGEPACASSASPARNPWKAR